MPDTGTQLTRCMCNHEKRDHNEATTAHECTHRYCACLVYMQIGEAGYDPVHERNRPFRTNNTSPDSILDTANRQWNQIQVWLARQQSWNTKERELKQQIRDAGKTKQAMEVEMLALRSQIDQLQEALRLLADAGRLPNFMLNMLAPDDEDHEAATYIDC